jgi:hypothetical protein
MQPLYIILGVIVIFLVLLHLTRQNDDIIENLETVCIGRTCVDENQIQKMQKIITGSVQLKSVHSGKCADVMGWSKKNGGNIGQWDCHRGNNQKWNLV